MSTHFRALTLAIAISGIARVAVAQPGSTGAPETTTNQPTCSIFPCGTTAAPPSQANATCVFTAQFRNLFNSGNCSTYGYSPNRENCQYDFVFDEDTSDYIFAYQACPECGSCVAGAPTTASPTVASVAPSSATPTGPQPTPFPTSSPVPITYPPTTSAPTVAPTAPTAAPTAMPSAAPSATPSATPTTQPPTPAPTAPTSSPTTTPTMVPTNIPSGAPTTATPTAVPTLNPTHVPTDEPTARPTFAPSHTPTTATPTNVPTTQAPTWDLPYCTTPPDEQCLGLSIRQAAVLCASRPNECRLLCDICRTPPDNVTTTAPNGQQNFGASSSSGSDNKNTVTFVIIACVFVLLLVGLVLVLRNSGSRGTAKLTEAIKMQKEQNEKQQQQAQFASSEYANPAFNPMMHSQGSTDDPYAQNSPYSQNRLSIAQPVFYGMGGGATTSQYPHSHQQAYAPSHPSVHSVGGHYMAMPPAVPPHQFSGPPPPVMPLHAPGAVVPLDQQRASPHHLGGWDGARNQGASDGPYGWSNQGRGGPSPGSDIAGSRNGYVTVGEDTAGPLDEFAV